MHSIFVAIFLWPKLYRDNEPRKREETGELSFSMVYNDSTSISWLKLIDLKEIFHECLPQMPTAYITRIIMDKKHRSIIATMDCIDDNNNNNNKNHYDVNGGDGMPLQPKGVFGGVCFRPFPERNFAEVVFLAISQNHQIKGFGTRLMNHLKQTLKRMGIYHIITFADNNAIDYFAKQGFDIVPPHLLNIVGIENQQQFEIENNYKNTEEERKENEEIDRLYQCKNLDFGEIIKDKYIKVYNGATLMHCRIIKNINYCELNEHLIENRKLLVSKIANISHSVEKKKGIRIPDIDTNIDILKIPGIKEAGFTKEDVNNTRSSLFENTHPSQMVELQARITGILKQLNGHCKASVFAKPVDSGQAPMYYNVIKNPMDLSKIQLKLDKYQYKSIRQFINDFKLIIRNCKLFNPKHNIFHTHAIEFDQYFDQLIQQY